MGLKVDVNFKGLAVPQAYVKVVNFTGSKTVLRLGVGIYVARGDTESFQYDEYVCAYDLNGGNPIEQAYVYLKTLPQFEAATNVLEEGQTV